jgi:ADP-ribose pyrophosphatase YjhB (NUDIX family)
VIFGFDNTSIKLLLVHRKFEPFKGKWSVIGGFLKKTETLYNAAQRIVHDLTGLDNVFLEQLHTFSELDRDSGARVLSTAYYALLKINEYNKERTESKNAKWFELDQLPSLIFDHGKMLSCALKQIQQKNRYKPIGLELLPEKFTIPQLQRLYESIYGKTFDSANFRKKILSFGFLKRLDEKDKKFSKRGAYYYNFDENKLKERTGDNMLFLM